MMRNRVTISAMLGLAMAGFATVPGLAAMPLEFTPGQSRPIPSAKNGQRRTKRAAAKRRNQARNRRAHR